MIEYLEQSCPNGSNARREAVPWGEDSVLLFQTFIYLPADVPIRQ